MRWRAEVPRDITVRVLAHGPGAEARAPSGGREYLLHKRRQRDLPKKQAAEARAAAGALLDRLSERARKVTRQVELEPAGSLLLDASFLVAIGEGEEFEALVESESRHLGETAPVSVVLSGPFPPYSFIESAAERRSGESEPPRE